MGKSVEFLRNTIVCALVALALAAGMARADFTIVASAGPGGAITPNGAVMVAAGSSATFDLAPDDCRFVADVRVDGVSLGRLTTYTFEDVQADHAIEVTFETDGPYLIQATAAAGGTITPHGNVFVACGQSRTFTIAPSGPDYGIQDVLVDGVSHGPISSYTFTDIQSNHGIFASFTLPVTTYTISVYAASHITVTPAGSQTVPQGSSVSFTIASDSPCYRPGVSVDGVFLGPIAGYVFSNIDRDHTLQVSSTFPNPTVVATSGVGGTVSPSGSQRYVCGVAKTYTILPQAGAGIQDVLVDGVSVGPVASYAFSPLYDDHAIHATFVDQGAPGVRLVYPNGGENLTIGEPLSISWTAGDVFGVTSVDLSMSRAGDAGPWETIATGLSNSGSYLVSPLAGPGTNTGASQGYTAYFLAEARDAAGFVGTDRSDAGVSLFDSGAASVDGGPVREFELRLAGPNPTPGKVELRFAVAREGRIALAVHDLQGRPVASLASGTFLPGRYGASWNGEMSGGRRAPTGVYFVRYEIPGRSLVKRVVVAR